MKNVFLGLGSNIGDRAENLRRAAALLKKSGNITVKKSSSVYLTSPVGYFCQQDFLNAVLKIETLFFPEELLALINEIEDRLGRKRVEKWGPRIIDIDILFYGDLIFKNEKLIIPHPCVCERLFVLKPLLDIDGEFVHPELNKSIREIFCDFIKTESAGCQRIEKLENENL